MKLLTYLCLASLALAMVIDYRSIRPLLNQKVTPDPIPFAGIVEVLTRHDKIPVARYGMGHDLRHNWDKISPFLVDCDPVLRLNPNLMLRGFPYRGDNGGMIGFETDSGSRFWVGGVEFTMNEGPTGSETCEPPSIKSLLGLVRDDTKEADLERQRDLLYRYSDLWIYQRSVHFVPIPREATNWTTVAAIISQRIATNYTVIRTPSESVPPGLHGHHWTIQANLDPEPDQWLERLVLSGDSIGIWTHIGDGKYLWSKKP